MRGPVVDLYGTAADAGTAGVGAVHVGERLSRSRALRRSLQLVPVPGELLRPRALRVDARELEHAAERQGRSLCRQAPQAQVRGIRLRLHLQAGARGLRRAQSVLDRGPHRAVAERLLPRQSFRMARAGRRREHAQRRVVLHARAEGARALRAGHRSDLGEPDQGRERPLDHEPRHQPGHHRLGRSGPDRRPQQGTYRPERPRNCDDPQAPVRRSRRHRPRPRSEGDHPQLERGEMRRAAVLPEKGKPRGDPARGLREISLAQGAPEGVSALLRPATRGEAGVRRGHGHRTITVSGPRAAIGPEPAPPLVPGAAPWLRAHRKSAPGGTTEKKGPPPAPFVGNRTAAPALQKKTWGRPAMPSAAYFRRQADICLRLSLISSDEEVSNRLIMMAQEYRTKADNLNDINAISATEPVEKRP